MSGSNLLIQKLLFRVGADVVQLWHPIDYVNRQSEAIDFVVDGQLHRRIDVAAFFVAAHVQVPVICAAVSQPVNQPGVTVKVKDDRLIGGEQAVEIAISQSVRMVAVALHLEEVNDVDKANLQIRKFFAQHGCGSQRFQRRDI